MLKKSFVAIAMLSFLFTATAFGQKEIVVWSKTKNAQPTERKANGKTPQSKSFTGSDEELGALIAWSHANKKNARKPKTGRLIDTSTGEIVWADEVKANQPGASQQRTDRRPNTGSLIDTSTGEIVWAHKAQANQPQGANARRNHHRQQPFDKGYLPPQAKAHTPPR